MSYATKPTILTTTRVFTGTLVSKVALGNTHTVMNHHFEKAQTWRSRSSSLVAKSKVATSMVSPLTLHLNIRAAYSTFVLPKSPFKDSRFEFFTIKGCLVVEKMERSIWELRILALRSQANWRFLLSLARAIWRLTWRATKVGLNISLVMVMPSTCLSWRYRRCCRSQVIKLCIVKEKRRYHICVPNKVSMKKKKKKRWVTKQPREKSEDI